MIVATAQPSSLVVALGSPANVNSGATGTEPLSYQWFFNNQPVTGATRSSLSISQLASHQIGEYYLSVSNAWGEVQSKRFRIDAPPSFPVANQPTSAETEEGKSISLLAGA